MPRADRVDRQRKAGGADLGPTQSKRAWARIGVDALGVADSAPDASGKYQRGRGLIRDAAEHGVMLTVPMLAKVQAFPDDWVFERGKTSQARQAGNAFPPSAALAVGLAIRAALEAA